MIYWLILRATAYATDSTLIGSLLLGPASSEHWLEPHFKGREEMSVDKLVDVELQKP